MTRPRSAEDLDELHLRARLRLHRRRRDFGRWAVHHIDGDPTNNDPSNMRLVTVGGITMQGVRKLADFGDPQSILVREASALVAAIDALREDEPIPLDAPPQYDGRDGSIEIPAAEEDAMIAGEDENIRRAMWGDR